MLKCILSTTIPAMWAPALCNADYSGLDARDVVQLEQWLKENDLTGAETFCFVLALKAATKYAALCSSTRRTRARK